MNIRLYKSCILNGNYREVFDTVSEETVNNVTRSPFENYLNTLAYSDISINNRYLNDSGIINIPIYEFNLLANPIIPSYTVYDYNYMRMISDVRGTEFETGKDQGVVTGYNLKKYYFINSVELKNDFAIITYSVDIWHTYRCAMWNILYNNSKSTDFRTRYGCLTSSKILKYNTGGSDEFNVQFYKPPMDYTGNNALKITETKLETDTDQVVLIATISRYKTEQSGVYSERRTQNYIIAKGNIVTDSTKWFYYNGETVYFDNISEYFETNPIYHNTFYLELMDKLIQLSSDSSTHLHGELKYYSVIKTVALPYSMLHYKENGVDKFPLETILQNNGNIVDDYIEIDNNKILLLPISSNLINVSDDDATRLKLYEGSIESNFKHIGIGFYTKVLPVIQNGSSIKYSCNLYISYFDFKIMISVQNTLYDVTNDFIIEIPIQVEDASTMALAKLTRELKDTTLKNQQASNLASFIKQEVGAIGQIVGGGALALATGGVGGVSAITGGFATLGTAPVEFYYSNNTIEEELKVNSAKIFTSNKGVSCESCAPINVRYGIVIFSIDSDNDIEVENSIKNFGYDCSEIVNAKQILNLDNATIAREKFNVVRFSAITVYGRFPQNIAQAFEKILTNGVKIWYTYDIQ